jgi:glycosyltransferase involved in cell wall biosynthesis
VRTLHVAALPFPTPQGTQALIASFLRAERTHGIDAHLAAYPEGCRGTLDHPIHALPPRTRRVLAAVPRSGPSVAKIAADLGLMCALPALVRRLAPALVVAHHVEAAAACALVGLSVPWLFCAHTSLAHELPTYFRAPLAPALSAAGALVDRVLVRAAPRTLAVSPRLSQILAAGCGRAVDTLPLPWGRAPLASAGQRAEARALLGFAPDDRVVLYAGNLDAYQGLPLLVAALSRARASHPALRLLVATESRARELEPLLAAVPGLREHTRVTGLCEEHLRSRAHAAADVVAVPRSVPGGVPIKLLDALARGIPAVVSEAACAGFVLGESCTVVADGDVSAFARALVTPMSVTAEQVRTALTCFGSTSSYASVIQGLARPQPPGM